MPPSASSASGAVRRSKGFARFALAVQYHGGSFLGVTYQGAHGEDCVRRQKRRNNETKWDTVDLRGHRSVEGRLREALDDLFGTRCWENIQFSSRTDRGVHALKNTFHVDIQVSQNSNNATNENHAKATKSESKSVDSNAEYERVERKLRDGINFYLARQSHGFGEIQHQPKGKQNQFMNELRILNACKSPEYMDNPYALTEEGRAKNQPLRVDWNARFSATQRKYVYRLLCYHPRQLQRHGAESRDETEIDNDLDCIENEQDVCANFGIPFEWDRAWCLPQHHSRPLDIDAMKEAAKHFVGTHDFSSFRGRLCQRSTPVVTMKDVSINVSESGTGVWGDELQQQKLVTMTFVANSFLYRQVRNMVGCLVEIGKHGGRLSPQNVKELLRGDWKQNNEKKDDISFHASPEKRSQHRPYSTAPPQGLFLVGVRHGKFRF